MEVEEPSRRGQPEEERLRARLVEAVDAARDAYADTARLIRLQNVIDRPSDPDRLLDDALAALSEVCSADVTCLVSPADDRVDVLRACGLAEGDPAFTEGWSWTPGLTSAVEAATVVTLLVQDGEDEVPTSLAALTIRSVTWVPLVDEGATHAVLGLLSQRDRRFGASDLLMLQSFATRLLQAMRSRRHRMAMADLARAGPSLTRNLSRRPLLLEAVDLLRRLTDVETAWCVVDDEGTGRVEVCSPPAAGPPPGPWPRPTAEVPGWAVCRAGQIHQGPLEDGDGNGTRTLLAIPVLTDGECTAVLLASRRGAAPYSPESREIAHILSGYVGAALANVTLYRALGRSEENLRFITDSISDLVSHVDPHGVLRYASPSHDRELSLDPTLLVGGELMGLVHPDDRETLHAALSSSQDSPRVEYRMRDGVGNWVWVESALRVAETDDPGVVLSSRVVEERRRLEDELRHRATHDTLTGLANRDLSGQWLEQALAESGAGEVGLLFCDLDGFKAVNDRLGHEAGDELLLQVAKRLRMIVGDHGSLARFGGDEFVVLLPEAGGREAVIRLSRRVVDAFGRPFPIAGESVQISIGVGGVLGRPGETTASAMLRDADAAMYAAKARGPGSVEIFDDDASARALERLAIRRELQDALRAGQFSLHYQPVVDLASGRVRSLEALLRWNHPERGRIPPDFFVPIAEESGMIVPIGRWVLETACRQLASWTELPGLERLSVSVNLAPVQLLHPQFPTQVVDVVSAIGLRPSAVLLEIIERGELPPELAQPMSLLRSAGLRLAIDDFGMHNSNLGYLRSFSFDCLKIDRTFVSGLGAEASGHATDRAIVRAVMAIADTLALDVVAEGVETEEQREVLLSLGCRIGQGYLMSRPLTVEDATRVLLQGGTGRAPGVPAPRREQAPSEPAPSEQAPSEPAG